MYSTSVSDDYKRYQFEYRFDGAEWVIMIVAKSPDEARERIKAMNWAQYRGEVAAIIPIPGAGLLNRIRALFRS